MPATANDLSPVPARRWQWLGRIFGLALALGMQALPGSPATAGTAAPVAIVSATNLAQLKAWARWPGKTNLFLSVTGGVAGGFPKWSLLILQDASGNAGVHLDWHRFPFLAVGATVAIQGPAHAGGGDISWLPEKLIDNDGLHGAQEASATVHLTAGRHPLEIRYHQIWRDMALALDYEGPQSKRQSLPAALLTHARDPAQPAAGDAPGLNYDYYEGIWDAIPDFEQLTPVQTGVTENLTLAARRRDLHFGLRFSGYVTLPVTGDYTFYLTADDGAQMVLEENPVTVTVLAPPANDLIDPPITLEAGQTLPVKDDSALATVSGSIQFIGPSSQG